MTTGTKLSGPFLAIWFLDKKVREGQKDTLDQPVWCVIYGVLLSKKHVQLYFTSSVSQTQGQIEFTKVRCLKEVPLNVSKRDFVG